MNNQDPQYIPPQQQGQEPQSLYGQPVQPMQAPYGQQQPMYGQQPYAQQQYAQQPQPVYAQPQYVPQTAPINDSGSFGWAVLGFFIPLAGLILFLVWRQTKPNCAKKAGIGAIVGAAFSIILSIASFALLASAPVSYYYSY